MPEVNPFNENPRFEGWGALELWTTSDEIDPNGVIKAGEWRGATYYAKDVADAEYINRFASYRDAALAADLPLYDKPAADVDRSYFTCRHCRVMLPIRDADPAWCCCKWCAPAKATP